MSLFYQIFCYEQQKIQFSRLNQLPPCSSPQTQCFFKWFHQFGLTFFSVICQLSRTVYMYENVFSILQLNKTVCMELFMATVCTGIRKCFQHASCYVGLCVWKHFLHCVLTAISDFVWKCFSTLCSDCYNLKTMCMVEVHLSLPCSRSCLKVFLMTCQGWSRPFPQDHHGDINYNITELQQIITLNKKSSDSSEFLPTVTCSIVCFHMFLYTAVMAQFGE